MDNSLSSLSHRIVEGLTRHYLFAAMRPETLGALVACGRIVTVEDGEVLFRKGDPGDHFYCILEGRVTIGYQDEDGRKHTFNQLNAGAVFGEIAVLDRQPRSADAVASGHTVLFAIPRDDFRQALVDECQLEDGLIRLLSERMRWVSDQIEHKNRAERELRKLSRAVEHSPAIVIIMDVNGDIEYVNPKFTATTGWQPAEVMGKVPPILAPEALPAEIHADLWGRLRSGQEWRGDLQSRRKDGGTYWESCSISPVLDENTMVTHFVAVMEDITERKRLQDELHRMATTDVLTGIANRRHFLERAQGEIARVARHGGALSAIMMDVDHFKKVNDTHGHAIGDAVLVALARTVAGLMRTNDLFGRLGGEEFAVILPDTDLDAAVLVAERLRQTIAGVEVPLDEGVLKMTVSLGVTQLGADENTVAAVLNRADAGLYQAKSGGRNRVQVA